MSIFHGECSIYRPDCKGADGNYSCQLVPGELRILLQLQDKEAHTSGSLDMLTWNHRRWPKAFLCKQLAFLLLEYPFFIASRLDINGFLPQRHWTALSKMVQIQHVWLPFRLLESKHIHVFLLISLELNFVLQYENLSDTGAETKRGWPTL